MVVYTPDVAADLGGANAVQAKAGVWIANLNTCLSNSNLGSITATLAHTHQTTQNFGQNGHSAALTHIGNDATIKGLRDTHKADLVSLMIIGPANGAGTAGLGQVLMSANGNAGTQATAVWHSTSSIVFSHEIGHNHGCGHDIDSANAYLKNGYSHGWHFTGSDNKGYRTVMAYSKSGFPATRVEYFSGTSVMYKGTATGTAAANNAKTISETNPKIQQYK